MVNLSAQPLAEVGMDEHGCNSAKQSSNSAAQTSVKASSTMLPEGLELVDGFPKLTRKAAEVGVDQNMGCVQAAEHTSNGEKEKLKRAHEPKVGDGQSKKPWADFFRNNRSPLQGTELEDVSTDRSGSCVIEEEDLLPLEKAWGFSLIGYFAGKNPDNWSFKNMIKSWGVKVTHFSHQSGWISFQFEDEKTMNSVLGGGPYFAAQVPLLLKPVPEFFRFTDEVMKFMPVWISLHCLPKECWGTKGMSKIVSQVGKPLRMDKRTATLDAVSYARALVLVDASKELVKEVNVSIKGKISFVQEISYDYYPTYCVSCKCIGHNHETCSREKVAYKDVESAVGNNDGNRLKVGQTIDKVCNNRFDSLGELDSMCDVIDNVVSPGVMVCDPPVVRETHPQSSGDNPIVHDLFTSDGIMNDDDCDDLHDEDSSDGHPSDISCVGLCCNCETDEDDDSTTPCYCPCNCKVLVKAERAQEAAEMEEEIRHVEPLLNKRDEEVKEDTTFNVDKVGVVNVTHSPGPNTVACDEEEDGFQTVQRKGKKQVEAADMDVGELYGESRYNTRLNGRSGRQSNSRGRSVPRGFRGRGGRGYRPP